MDLTDFNCSHLSKQLDNISKEQKSIFLCGDFNVNFLNHSAHNKTMNFFILLLVTLYTFNLRTSRNN